MSQQSGQSIPDTIKDIPNKIGEVFNIEDNSTIEGFSNETNTIIEEQDLTLIGKITQEVEIDCTSDEFCDLLQSCEGNCVCLEGSCFQ